MNLHMRLFRRPPKTKPLPPESEWTWYAELDRRTRISLKTSDKKLAEKSYARLKKLYLTRNLAILEGRAPTKRLEDFAEEYLEWSFQTKRPFTTQTDSQALRRALRYFGPTTPLGSITRRQVDAWLASMGQEVKRVSANTWFRHFKASLSKAVDWKYLKENPCQGVKQLAVDEPLPRYLTQDEFSRILSAEPDPAFRRLWEIYLRTGCRRAEILQLTGQDLDYQTMHITVARTKNRRIKRVPMTPEIAALFRSIPVQVGRLFPWTLDYVTHHFHKTARAAGVTCRLHDLRHTYGSWMIQGGVPLRVVQDLMGHRSSKTTERYAWASESQQAEAQGRIRIGEE
jgi:integrase